MTEPVVTAPGKVLWAGEYAVLDGGPAVLTAVDRRVVARVHGDAQPGSPFLRAVAEEIEREQGEILARRADRLVVDSSALQHAGKKLGLGSSAAATVAATAAVLAPVRPSVATVHRLAHRAHGLAQSRRGARGSGADVAAAVHGGALVAHRAGDEHAPLAVTPLPFPAALSFALVWTGVPAETTSLVAQVSAARGRTGPALREIADAAAALAAAFSAGDAAAAIDAVIRGAEALAALGEAAGAPLVPAIWSECHGLARVHGGAAKPTGAGGGDLLLAVFPSADAAEAFRSDATGRGMTPVSCAVSPSGVDLQPPREPSKFPGIS